MKFRTEDALQALRLWLDLRLDIEHTDMPMAPFQSGQAFIGWEP